LHYLTAYRSKDCVPLSPKTGGESGETAVSLESWNQKTLSGDASLIWMWMNGKQG